MCGFDFWAMLIVLATCLRARVSSAQALACDPNDLKALRAFASSILWDVTDYSPDCCSWRGVTCQPLSALGLEGPGPANSSGRVVALQLQNSKLLGQLDHSLGALDQLRTLNLSGNSLIGSLPPSLFVLPNLKSIDLSSNQFSGGFGFGLEINLLSLEHLDVSDNSLNGSLPAGLCESSSSSTTSSGVTYINFSANNFSGPLPPGFGNCSALQQLWLGRNCLVGGLPDDLFRLGELTQLRLAKNLFSGTLDARIGNLSSLVLLDVSCNGFSGSLPDAFSTLRSLQTFTANSNGFTGQLPGSLVNCPTLTALTLRNNSLTGPIAINCSAMGSLASLDLGSNQLSGPIPDNLPSCRSLRVLSLGRNKLQGQVPETFRNFLSLTSLALSNTSLRNITAALDILQHCTKLASLVLTSNFKDEAMPSDPDIRFPNVKVLIIANCRLSGTMPQWLQRCTQLQLLDISWNRLAGAIPEWVGSFGLLFYLDLSNNSFTGGIPKSITGLDCLVNRTISAKNGSSLPDFPYFMRTNLSLKGNQYNQVSSFRPTIDLSHNLLSGEIWPEFGNLKRLHVLNLGFNSFTGPIPSYLSLMTSVESLDLSHNKLSGTIPRSLMNLSFLSMFSVAYNDLVGEIPFDGQFFSFQNSSFEGNPGLCGKHVLRECRSDQRVTARMKRNKGIIVGMAFGIGLGTMFLLAIVFVIVLRIQHWMNEAVDPENVGDGYANVEEISSRYVVLFQNKDNSDGLLVEDLLKTTDNFDQSNIIGCGGFGLVYKATLPDGRKVAIKRLSGECVQMEREFQAELDALSRAQHPNLVLLQGYCSYKNDKLLIYSYMENSSLDYWLHEKSDGASCLEWETRLRIVRGVANGLAYLHQSCEPHILHRDIKSSNILLDENFEAHLADFGLARLILPYKTHVTTDLVGTLGYIPPEYGQASVASYKGDVYSFGVVLLEVLTGRRPMDMCKPKGTRDLISWVTQMKKEKKVREAFDPFIYDKERDKDLLRLLEIASLCLSENPKVRPSTQQLVSWIDNIGLSL